jgi:hypothetical protein
MTRSKRARRLDPRRAKIHRSYTVAEVASLYGVHRNTVRHWTRRGLETVNAVGTILILGEELRRHLTCQQAQRRVRCSPGTMYCLRCRAPRTPPEGLIEAVIIGPTTVNLRGLCPDCNCLMHRRASLTRLGQAGFGNVTVHAGAVAPSR